MLFYPLSSGDWLAQHFNSMSEEMEKAVARFCDILPNLKELHHPADYSRLLKIVYLSIKNNETIPLNLIRKTLESKDFIGFNNGNLEDFMSSCNEYIEKAKDILYDAQRCNILKM